MMESMKIQLKAEEKAKKERKGEYVPDDDEE